MPLTLTALTIFPVKATAGIELQQCRAEKRGLAHDRRWMIVTPEGKARTQRELPRLVLIRTQVGDGGALTLRATGLPALSVPVPTAAADRLEVEIWEDRLPAALAGERSDLWLTRFLGQESRLVHLPDDVRRRPSVQFDLHSQEVSFADGFPYLLLTEESLADLNGRLGQPVGMNRFRPNLVVAGAEPYAEDDWRELRMGGVVFKTVKPCSRCKVTTVDPQTGEVGSEPLKTLATYRTREKKVYLGTNLVAVNQGPLKVGDPVEIIS